LARKQLDDGIGRPPRLRRLGKSGQDRDDEDKRNDDSA
jgi:hypothetical protein